MEQLTVKLLTFLGQKVVRHLASSGNDGASPYPALVEVKKFLKTTDNRDGRSVSNTLYYLKKRKYIKIISTENNKKVALTMLGARQFLQYCLLTENKTLKTGSSGLVILSVPEAERHYRDFLRNKLLDEGFVLLNNGVYSTSRKFSLYLPFLVRILGLEKYVIWGEFKQSQ
jgi:hypothetical protein